jgi:hypothetical protein
MPSASYLIGLVVWLALLAGTIVSLLRTRRTRRLAKRSTRFVDIGLSCWCLFAVLTLPELWFAFVYDATDAFSQTNVSRRWYDRHVRANKAGYRDDRELPTSRDEGRVYVGFLGDSFTLGHGVRRVGDRFTDRVQSKFDSQFPDRTVIYNCSLPGTEIIGLTNKILPGLIFGKTPMDIVVYVFVPNDVEYMDPRTSQYYQEMQSHTPKFFLFRNTYFYNWLYYRFAKVAPNSKGNYYEYLAEASSGPPWDEFLRFINLMRRECRYNHAELRVVIFPFLSTLGKDDPFAPMFDKLIAHCGSEEIPCLDLRPVLQAHSGEGLWVNRFDAHPNERAHALAAEAILEDLSGPVKKRLDQK